MMLYRTDIPSPVGPLTLAGSEKGLHGLWLAGQKYYMASLPEAPVEKRDLPLFGAVCGWLERYFAGEGPDPSALPLAPFGSGFRRAVWQELLAIPYGTVTTYGAIAQRLDKPARAVGGAVGRNPISIIIPCHRVVGSDGSLTGYAGGVTVKARLLALEGVTLQPGGKVRIK